MVQKTANAILLGLCLLAPGIIGCSWSPQAKEARFLERGKKQFQRKDYARAILEFKNAVQAMPQDAEPYYQLGLAYLAASDVKMAAACFRRASELNPKHAGAQLQYAQLMSMSDSKELVEEALKRAQDLLSLLPNDVEALNLLAFTELRLGKPESAEAHLEQALQKAPDSLKSSVALARARLARRDVKGAEDALRQAVAQSPKSPDPLVVLGEFYLALGRTAESEQEFRRALQIDPKHGPALLDLGAMQVRAGQNQLADQTFQQLSALPDKRYKPAHALFLFQSGKREGALAEFEKLAKEDPADREARTRLVTAYLALKRTGDATGVLTEALKKNPRDTDALLQRSRIYLSSAKYTEAQADLDQTLRFRKESAEAHYLSAKLHQARGETSGRQQELGEALRLEPGFAAARIELAEMLVAAGGGGSALKLLDEAPQAQKETVPFIVQRNWALLGMGDQAAARKGIDRVLAASRTPDALLQDAVLKMGQKDYPGMRASAEEILKQSPEDVRALRILVESYAAQKQMPLGLQKVREYAAGQPKSAAVQEFFGWLLMGSGDRAGARQALEVAKANSPGLVVADLSLAQLDMSEGKLNPARERLSALVSRDSRLLSARLMLGLVEELDGKRSTAIEHYRKGVDIDPRNVAALNNLAYLLAESNQADDALKYAQQAKEISPNSPVVDDTLGWTYFRKGIYTSAVPYLESAVAKGDTARRRYHLAMAYMKAGDRKRGEQTLQAALKMDPNLPEAEVARQLSKSLK